MSTTADQVFETWEEMEASGALDRKLNGLQLNGLDERQNPKLVNGKNTNGRMIILGDDGMRSQYVSPKPTVKILKRPQRDGNTPDGLANGDKPKQPIKSLKQREQEYAEARKRILGEEKSPEETITTAATTITTTTTTNDDGIFQSKTNAIFNSSIPQQQQQQQQQYIPAPAQVANVIRMPNGPVDGTTGFNVRR